MVLVPDLRCMERGVTSSRGGRGRDARAPVKGAQRCVRARRLCPRAMRACGQDARAPRRAGKTPAHPGAVLEQVVRTSATVRDARAPRAACGGDACVPVKGRRAACGRDARAPRRAGGGDACAPQLTRVGFLASSCAPSPISAVRTPTLPLRSVWEHCGAIAIAGDRNEFRSTLAPPGSAVVSPACAPEARAPRASPGGARVSPACAPETRVPRASARPNSPFSPCGRRESGDEGQTRSAAA